MEKTSKSVGDQSGFPFSERLSAPSVACSEQRDHKNGQELRKYGEPALDTSQFFLFSILLVVKDG